jgi:hypothetical protein
VLRRVHELRRARLHCSGGAGPRLKLGQASRPSGKLSEGLDRAEVGGKGFGHGGCPRAALVGRGEVTRAAGELGELGVVQRRQRGRWPCTRVGFIAAARGGRGRVGVHVRACSGQAPECQPTSNTWWFTSVRVQRPIWSP